MNVLVGCEFSGVVREAFRVRGHNAWSNDLLPAADNSPFHLQGSIFDVLTHSLTHSGLVPCSWDLAVLHPPCTYLAVSGARWWKDRQAEQKDAINFFLKLAEIDCPKLAIENPIGIMSSKYKKPDQIVQPWMFGHGETKATCLWLKGLPKLTPTQVVEGRIPRVHLESPGVKDGLTRQQRRSITYQGIADAMAEQWG